MRSYDFDFGFVIPASTNSWQATYDLPRLAPAQVAEYVASPGGHQSDSFYFVDGRLVMHNKAIFSYR